MMEWKKWLKLLAILCFSKVGHIVKFSQIYPDILTVCWNTEETWKLSGWWFGTFVFSPILGIVIPINSYFLEG